MSKNTYGICTSDETETKQRNFRGLLNIIMPTARKMIVSNGAWKPDPRFWIYDLNAARSSYPDDSGHMITGSAVIGVEAARAFGLNYQAFLCELNPENTLDLSIHFADDRHVTVLTGDNRQTLPSVLGEFGPERFGYIYADPNNANIPTDLLTNIYSRRVYRRTDLIVNVAAASVKRIVSGAGREDASLLSLLERVDKKYWLVRDPHGKHQWTFLVGTNWANFPEWEKEGFYRLDGDRGRHIWQTVALSKKQVAAQTQPSFFS